MVKYKWLSSTRNKLANIWVEMESCAAIEGAQMTESERKYIKTRLKEIIKYIDEHTK